MSVSGISSPYNTQALASVLQASPTGTSAVGGTTDGDVGQPKVSRQAQFLNKLQQLATSDPAKFKQVTTDIAAKLTQAAQAQGQTAQGQSLSALAAKFQTVAQTGDLSALQPAKTIGVQAAYGSASGPAALFQSLTGQQGATGHHHGHHHGGGSPSGSAAEASPAAGSSPGAANALASVFSQINQEVAVA